MKGPAWLPGVTTVQKHPTTKCPSSRGLVPADGGTGRKPQLLGFPPGASRSDSDSGFPKNAALPGVRAVRGETPQGEETLIHYKLNRNTNTALPRR